MDIEPSTARAFEAGGALARHVPGFAPRLAQQEMAQAIAAALEQYGTLVCEAGTGTGKTFAYLVPALLSGRKVIISTGTRALQDQLFHRDLPVVRRALGVPVRCALLKGRANYLCTYRLQRLESEGRLASRELLHDLRQVREWAGRTDAGDIAEVTAVSEDSSLWPLVTSTVDNCLGGDCPDYGRCHVMKARRAAQEAELVIINHHLLFADMALRGEGHGDLLPSANAFIIDEAHQLPEVATQFFGLTLGSRQLTELGSDTLAELKHEAADDVALMEAAQALEPAVRDLRQALGGDARRTPWRPVQGQANVTQALTRLREALEQCAARLELAAERGKGLENCYQRALTLLQRLALFHSAAADAGMIDWLEVFSRSFSLNRTPLVIAEPFQAHLAAMKASWIFTSATLAVAGSFSHFISQLGLHDAATARWDSPFDYRNNGLLYVPAGLPDPSQPEYVKAVVEAAIPVLQASRGRAFMLFTSHRALQRTAELLDGRLEFPLLIQGTVPRQELLRRFQALGNAVLLGTGSFWEGIDVRGEALSCVIIDKLPFAAPDDPILQARVAAIRDGGGNPFMDYQIPQAVIALKQGAGRLIRDVTDRGVLMLCDPRLVSRPYGRVFLRSIPPFARTRELARVQQFFAAGAAGIADTAVP